MDVSGASSVMAQAAIQQKDTQGRAEAQVGLLRQTQEQPAQAVNDLINSVPQPEGSKGQNLDLKA